jgi:hypothetical protein
MGFNQEVARFKASSHVTSSNWPDPLGPTLRRGDFSLDGAFICIIPAEPFAHNTPLINRVVLVSLYVGYLVIFNMYIYSAAAGAHVACSFS